MLPDLQMQCKGDSQAPHRRHRYIDSRSRSPPLEQLRDPHAVHRPPRTHDQGQIAERGQQPGRPPPQPPLIMDVRKLLDMLQDFELLEKIL